MSKARILLADDSELNIIAIGEYLDEHGYELLVARDGQEAIAKVLHEAPDLLLLDIQMPVMDGLQVIRFLRAQPRFETLPIVALTALAMPGDRERCMDAGATEYVTKPVSMKEMVAIMQKLLRQ